MKNSKKISSAVLALTSVTILCSSLVLSKTASASEPFIAQITMFGGNFAPRNWAFCNGQLLAISQNQALFALLGTTYGGDGRTSFGLPDLRGRVAIHPGTGPGLSTYKLGQKGGVETVTLTTAQMPSHTHTITAIATAKGTDVAGDSETPAASFHAKKNRTDQYNSTAAAPNVDMKADSVAVTATAADTGDNGAHTNIQPFLGINHIIALEGIFPSRN